MTQRRINRIWSRKIWEPFTLKLRWILQIPPDWSAPVYNIDGLKFSSMSRFLVRGEVYISSELFVSGSSPVNQILAQCLYKIPSHHLFDSTNQITQVAHHENTRVNLRNHFRTHLCVRYLLHAVRPIVRYDWSWPGHPTQTQTHTHKHRHRHTNTHTQTHSLTHGLVT